MVHHHAGAHTAPQSTEIRFWFLCQKTRIHCPFGRRCRIQLNQGRSVATLRWILIQLDALIYYTLPGCAFCALVYVANHMASIIDIVLDKRNEQKWNIIQFHATYGEQHSRFRQFIPIDSEANRIDCVDDFGSFLWTRTAARNAWLWPHQSAPVARQFRAAAATRQWSGRITFYDGIYKHTFHYVT